MNNSHKTAMTRKKISRPMGKLLDWSLFHEPLGTHLDYGCGKGADILHGSVGFDPYYRPDKPQGQFNTVTCFYVLNVVDAPTRKAILEELFEYSSNLIAIAVRTDKIKGEPHLDGVLTAKKTFQKQFTHEELLDLVKGLQVDVVHQEKGFVILKKRG
jgi:DNA phosphorothioation-associated putative methyltransferase